MTQKFTKSLAYLPKNISTSSLNSNLTSCSISAISSWCGPLGVSLLIGPNNTSSSSKVRTFLINVALSILKRRAVYQLIVSKVITAYRPVISTTYPAVRYEDRNTTNRNMVDSPTPNSRKRRDTPSEFSSTYFYSILSTNPINHPINFCKNAKTSATYQRRQRRRAELTRQTPRCSSK